MYARIIPEKAHSIAAARTEFDRHFREIWSAFERYIPKIWDLVRMQNSAFSINREDGYIMRV